MKVCYDKCGAQIRPMASYPIASATAIAKGQVVKLSAGKVVAASAAETGAILGVAAENHPGVADVLNPAANGTEILVYDSPYAVSELAAPEITASSGSSGVLVSTGGLSDDLDDNALAGGSAVLVGKGATSTITDPIGTVYPISASDGEAQSVTLTGVHGGVKKDDVFAILPPLLFCTAAFDSAGTGLVLSTAVSLPVRVVGTDPARKRIFITPRLHQLAVTVS